MMGTRMFTASRVSYTKRKLLSSSYLHNLVVEMNRQEDGHETYEKGPKDANIKRDGKEENISLERFYQLDKVSM